MLKIETLVIGTGNAAKKEYYSSILSDLVRDVKDLDDYPNIGKPQEAGKTAEENAEIKAGFYYNQIKLPIFSIDESLWVDFLPLTEQPGVHVRRIMGGKEATDEELFKYWEGKVRKTDKKKRTGYWHMAYCLILSENNVLTFAIDYPILFFYPSSGIWIPGWPMSSLEGPAEFGKPHSELNAEEKKILKTKAGSIIISKIEEFVL